MTYYYAIYLMLAVFVLSVAYISFFHIQKSSPTTTAPVHLQANEVPAAGLVAADDSSSIGNEVSDAKPAESMKAITEKNVSEIQQQTAKERVLPAPEFSGITGYINTDPTLTMASLRGKVVVVFFWTYSCINCERTVPYVEALYEKYKDQGLVVVGVHTPELANERVFANVQQAVKDQGITFPVVMDSDYSTWRSYNNEYWPNRYIIDKQGNIQYSSAGEGNQDTIEKVVQLLLEQA